MNKLVSEDLLSYIEKSLPPKQELVTRRDIRKYSIATGQKQRKFLDGDEAPPMFHLTLFWDLVELDQLKSDGVPVDPLLPNFPLQKEMAGGLKIQYHKPIYPGDWLTATETLTNIYEKTGSKGPIIFYEVLMTILNEKGEKVITQKTTRLFR